MTDSTQTPGADGGDAVVSAFEAVGADYLFCSSGSEWAPVWESLARRHRDGEPAPGYLDLTHETVAVGMATGYGLVTRRPQGVLLHAAPGLLQGSMAIHGALLTGVPMVVASSESSTYGDGPGQDPGGQWYRNLSIVGGPHGVARPFTKWSNEAADVHTLPTMITRSAELARRAPAGPAYLNIPLEILLEEWDGREAKPVVAPGSTHSSPDEADSVARMIREAENPVIVTETAGREAGGFEALVAFAEAWDIPVVEPDSAVCGNFPRTHPLHGGGDIGPWMDEADLILLVNCRVPFYPPSRRPAKAKVVVIDEVPQRPHLAYQVLFADRYLEGGVAHTLRQLARRATDLDGAAVARRRAAQEERYAAEQSAVAEAESRAERAEGTDPVLVAATLRRLLDGSDAIVVDETITHSRTVKRHLKTSGPDSYFYVQGGLGQGIAVALGAKLAARDRPVVFTVGDGAFTYNPVIPSYDAARTYGLPVLIVVFNNRVYRSMNLNHRRFYPEGAAAETGEWLGTDLHRLPRLAAFAEPFGMHTETVDTPDALAPALERALKAVADGTTAVVDVLVTR
ncbi:MULTISPECIES: thiamine pyrophosphate-dependent enzyme [unclassified Streptomyces]|uniref:thiamine pyrophosphate-dependent enzyme n=1 Tax=unclassified Streptomyces TaxID=2593676 RepID=UPI0001C1A28A|nr:MULTISPECIES: thiamine pyrophosphate-dependent enzyme [unclassified Streptomyces]AEN13848.1 thiamine pyrophosphate protein domain protein TPP-binding protein [Streptomyces sp. SirexAA-E]MYR67920.1 thiamine pyrophosphate-binding protein [Streptomyces sp. SID4939]MYS01611.1 thiamine pyrophosphate-binding protein [Streptomyces sp. SID4940]MYT67737.1 thiamine pyrophosphate-binding protein [Streptomyces sp. SID8357]MYT86581.1 thiamine pyrophosphate-binding protein [Streptomyces sp. SID8360]